MRNPRDDLAGAGRGAVARQRAPMRVGVLYSRRAPGLRHLLEDDPNRGTQYEIVCCLASDDSPAEKALAASHGIPVIVHPIRRFLLDRACRLSDPSGRAAYDATMVERLASYRLDLVLLTSYLYAITEPMLSCFQHRIINVHHGDLTRRDRDGRARFIGLRAVRDAVHAGECETRATVHLVTSEIYQGPPFLRSWAFPVSPLAHDALTWGATDMLKAYVHAHEEWMIHSTWGRLLTGALELIATGRLDLAALARAMTVGLSEPWDLDASGAIVGDGPVPVPTPLMVEGC
jgi:folate-dependent phosphoribosylglycinamide formyltransferase PurN